MKLSSAHSTAPTAVGRDARSAAREIRGALVACVSDAVLAACGRLARLHPRPREVSSHNDGACACDRQGGKQRCCDGSLSPS
jgi:hypothetical protein